MSDILNDNAIDLLTEFLTGGEVAFQSVGLGMPETSMTHQRAKKYFALRAAFDVRGYDSAEEAKPRILAAIESSKVDSK